MHALSGLALITFVIMSDWKHCMLNLVILYLPVVPCGFGVVVGSSVVVIAVLCHAIYKYNWLVVIWRYSLH